VTRLLLNQSFQVQVASKKRYTLLIFCYTRTHTRTHAQTHRHTHTS